MAWELPTATASASTPVAATNSAACSGSVRTPGGVHPVLAADLPQLGLDVDAMIMTVRDQVPVAATFSSYGSADASNITEVAPNSTAARTRSASVA